MNFHLFMKQDANLNCLLANKFSRVIKLISSNEFLLFFNFLNFYFFNFSNLYLINFIIISILLFSILLILLVFII